MDDIATSGVLLLLKKLSVAGSLFEGDNEAARTCCIESCDIQSCRELAAGKGSGAQIWPLLANHGISLSSVKR